MLSALFLHIHHHSMATFIIDEVSDSIPKQQLLCFWLWGGLRDGGRQGAGNHRLDSGERGKNTTVFRTGEEGSVLVGPVSIPLPLVCSLWRQKQSSMLLTLSIQYLYKLICTFHCQKAYIQIFLIPIMDYRIFEEDTDFNI